MNAILKLHRDQHIVSFVGASHSLVPGDRRWTDGKRSRRAYCCRWQMLQW